MSWQSAVDPVVQAICKESEVPGMVIGVVRESRQPELLAVGTDAQGNVLKADTLFPVASITKLATALAVLRLADAGAFKLDDPLAKYLPEAAAAQDGSVTLSMLLCHTSGLPFDLAPAAAPYNRQLDWPTLAQACLKTPLLTPPLKRVLYSNIGPGLLAIVIERLTGQIFAEALDENVLWPLHLEGYMGIEPPRSPAAIAHSGDRFAGTDLEFFNSAFWRALAMPWGGLVTTTTGALALVRAFAGLADGFLSHEMAVESTHDQTGGLGGGFFKPLLWPLSPWGLGAELRGEKTPHWTPPEATYISFGHAGASGCLVWHDPVLDLTYAILGTRGYLSWWMRWPEIGAAIIGALA